MESLFQYLGIVIEKSVLFILWFRVTQEYDGWSDNYFLSFFRLKWQLINNAAVCLLYTGSMRESMLMLEENLGTKPDSIIRDETVLNVCTLYELESSLTIQRKLGMLRLASQWRNDNLNIACFKLNQTKAWSFIISSPFVLILYWMNAYCFFFYRLCIVCIKYRKCFIIHAKIFHLRGRSFMCFSCYFTTFVKICNSSFFLTKSESKAAPLLAWDKGVHSL